MSIVTVSEQFQPNKYLIITLNTEEGITSTANVLVSDLRTNTINLVNVQQGPQGEQGLVGPVGPPGKDGLSFSILPVNSGGTNNSIFNSGYLISYDGNKLASSAYTIDDIIQLASINSSAITGIIAGTGLQKTDLVNNNVILDIQVGDGLIVNNNAIVVDDSIARKAEIGFGDIQGVLPISKGGTNSSLYTNNRLIYFDGASFKSFPLNTGQIVVSGSSITIEAGSGLIGGGNITVPNGSVLLQIGASADILVEESSIVLSNTGQPGIYSKVQTDSKGRVIAGSNLTTSDIISFLGYTPWHSGNDGSGSGLDADLLDGQDGSFYTNIANISGSIPPERLPNYHDSDKIGTKFRINTKGIIEEVLFADSSDIISGLGFRPLNAEANDTMEGLLTLSSGVDIDGKVELYDNLFLLGKNNPNISPSEPRGFTFRYGGLTANRTGLLAYFPTAQPGSQLRLVTNVFGSAENTDIDPNDPAFQDDINGGSAETVFITENLQGDRLTVLFREIADNLYINTNQPQQIVAVKEFLQGIGVLGQIKFLSDGVAPSVPPFDLGGNTLKVIGLNADLLDDQDGSYYRNASNITGSFLYDNVSFDHIDGDDNYISKFDGTNKIVSSNMKQTDNGDIQIETNLIVGNNASIEGLSSVSVGSDNQIYSNNSLVVGQNNIASGQNAIALNQGSIAKAKNSIALNSYGLAYLENQTAFGGFATFDNTGLLLEHGQYSSIAAYLKGTETNGSWASLTPTIQLPKDKTVAFNIELLINKGLSSGVAHFTFNSGIVNNVTYRDPSNITNLINQTIIPNSGIKYEAFNNSQIRRHSHKISYLDFISNQASEKTQYVWSTDIPATNLPVEFRYLKDYYFYSPEKVRITGVYEKNYDGSLVLDINRPRYYNSFYQNAFSPTFVIVYDRPHNAINGAVLDVNYTSGSVYLPPSAKYSISSIIDDKTLAVKGPSWQGSKFALENGGSRIVLDNTKDLDKYFYFASSGIINGTNILVDKITNDYGYSLDSFIKHSFNIKITHNNNIYNRVIINIDSNNKTIQINSSIKSLITPYADINGPVSVVIDDWSANLFKNCDSLYIDTEIVPISGLKKSSTAIFNDMVLPTNVADSGAGSVISPQSALVTNPINETFSYQYDTKGEPSFSILSSIGISNVPDGQTVSISPLFANNKGFVDAYAKNNFDCSYSSELSTFNANTGVYVRYIKPDKEEIFLYDLSYKNLDFISAPVKFSLVSGAFSDDNDKFVIKNEDNRYFLYVKDPLFYDDKNILSIRVKCEPSNTQFASAYEKPIYITLNKIDNAAPTVNYDIEPQSTLVDELFIFNISSGLFFDIEQDPLTISASLNSTKPLPSWLAFDSGSLILSGTPSACDIGLYPITIKATDPSGLFVTTNLFLEVYQNEYGALEIFSEDVKDRLKINSINLSNNKVNEKTPNVLVGELSHEGGYNPYVVFGPGYNSASGTFVENSHMFRHAQPIYQIFSGITTMSGSPAFFGWLSKVTPEPNTLSGSEQTRVTNIFIPTIMSGTPIYHNKIFFDDVYTDWKNFAIFTGQNIEEYQLTENFGIDIRAKYINDYSITLSHSLTQESDGLILTEENDAIEHETLVPKPLFTGYPPAVWSRQTNCEDPAESGLKHIIYPKQTAYITITTEDRELLYDEDSNKISGLIYDDRIGDVRYPIRIQKAYRENINYDIVSGTTNITLNYLNRPENDLSISNIDYSRSSLDQNSDLWIFGSEINNAVVYFQNLGNNNISKLVSEDRSYSGYFYPNDPFEYAILTTEDNLSILPENEDHNGSKIEFSSRYEIIESSNIFSTNEYFLSENIFDQLICENEDRLVNKHFIHAKNGEAYILFPGINTNITVSYPTIVSYTKEFISAQINETYEFLGYYEPDLSVRPSPLAFSESDFYYTWGKLIPYRFSTNEYAIRLSDMYNGPTTSGSLIYSGVRPESNSYFPEKLLIGSKIDTSGYCPNNYETSYINGIKIHTNNNYSTNYVTGIATFYTSYASNNINISSNRDINKDFRIDDNVYLYNPISNNANAMLPRIGSYSDIVSGTKNSILVRNFFLFPTTKTIAHTGSISLNLDRNHNQIIKNADMLNLLPIRFNDVYNDSDNIRIPKHNLFAINSISGQKIFSNDAKSYLLRPDKYLDGTVLGDYLTNGVSFLGSLFHNNETMYDIRLSSTKLIPEYKKITFEYNLASKQLVLNIPSGLVSSFDNIRLSNFQPLAAYMIWDNSKTYQTGFKIFPENISLPRVDETPNRDYILLEKSSADLQPINFIKLTFESNLFNNSVSGTCNLDVNLANRMEPGYLINYNENTVNSTGHQYINHIPGYSFSGFVPKYHDIISSNSIINDDRIGFSSIFNTGSATWMEGARSLRFANSQDVGYTEFYAVGSSGFVGNSPSPYTGLKGIGSEDIWYIVDDINTSGSNKKLEFLYLGYNANSIRFFGTLQSSGTTEFHISKLSLDDQIQIEKFESLGQITGVEPIFTTGTLGSSGNFDISVAVSRFDLFIVDLLSYDGPPKGESYLSLNCYAADAAQPAPLLLSVEENTVLNNSKTFYPKYLDHKENLFYILPSFNTNTKYCNQNLPYSKNTNLFYNGNIMTINNFSSINSYALLNDQLRIKTLNEQVVSGNAAIHVQKINSTNENLTITGISLDGPKLIPSSIYDYKYSSLREDTDRGVFTFGSDNYLPNTGNISFCYHYSGSFDLINYNNIYTQIYGGYTSRWPQDFDAVLTDAPITGIYKITTQSTPCSSGKLCVAIEKYSTTLETDTNFYYGMNNASSLLSLIDINKSYYFDFDDYAANLSNVYRISDVLSDNIVTISTPYMEQYLGASGLVFIIPSKYNIKSHLNPNYNNTFLVEKPASIVPENRASNIINYFDSDTKKWINLYHLTSELPSYSGYPVSINNINTTLIYNNTNPINISNVRRIDTNTLQTSSITDIITVNIGDNSTIADLIVSTENGSPSLSNTLSQSLPKIFVSGLSAYGTKTQGPLSQFNNYINGSGWNVNLEIQPLNKAGVYPISIIARDETGQDTLDLSIVVRDNISLKPSYPTGYATLNENSWSLVFDLDTISDIDDTNKYLITVSNHPSTNYSIFYHNSNKLLKVVGSSASGFSATGNFNPIISISNKITGDNLVSSTGSLSIIDNLNNRPDYLPTISNLKKHYFINLDNNENINFSIPVFELASSLFINLNLFNLDTYRAISFNNDINHHIVNIGSFIETTHITNAQLSFNIEQNKYINGIPQPYLYTSDTENFDVTVYRPLVANQSYNNSINNVFDINEAWTYEFVLEEGACKHRPDKPPRVKLINTPSFGDVAQADLSYRIRYRYMSNEKYWIVSLVGLPDRYGRYAPSTGNYTIQYFADDHYTSSVSGFFEITYQNIKKMNFIQSNVYTTPNNEFFINADIFDPNLNAKLSNNIVFDGENSLSIAADQYRYNPYFETWEYYATGNKLLDKWDARIILSETYAQGSFDDVVPSITLQCKGIATDKITAIAKVDLVELQNNNIDVLDTLPIQISGVAGGSTPPAEKWSEISGLIVEQGRKWELRFSTIFGLASPQHPPTIILSGMPSTCSGYYPDQDPFYNDELSPETALARCIQSRPSFNEQNQSWNFSFTGDPSCSLLGEVDFAIIAIDTDLTSDPIYIEPSDTFESIFTYIAPETPHPGPFISQDDGNNIQIEIEPFCNTYYNSYTFGPSVRDICPQITGLTGIFISGSVPSGIQPPVLEYTGPEGNIFNSPVFNNTNVGKLVIQGQVLDYPKSGQTYDEVLYLTVVDARGNSITEEISFSIKVEPLDPSINTTMFFSSPYPVFSPSTGNDPVEGNISVKQPAAFDQNMTCLSNLPQSLNKNCTTFPVFYSGSPTNLNRFVRISAVENYEDQFNEDINNFNPPYAGASTDPYVYILSDSFSGTYFVQTASAEQINSAVLPNYILEDDKYIALANNIPIGSTGLADILVEKYKNKDMTKLNDILGKNATISVDSCLLGNGRIVQKAGGAGQGPAKFGIGGFLSPTWSGYIPSGGVFDINDIFVTGLNFIRINQNPEYSVIKYTKCQETGYFRVSGIVLPPIYVEITDPVETTNSSSTIKLAPRLSYGDSPVERSKPQNNRGGSANYVLIDHINNTVVQNGDVTISAVGISTTIDILASTLNTSANNSGTIFEVNIQSTGSLFPSYNNSLDPAAVDSSYYWIHRFGFADQTPQPKDLPPVAIVEPKIINIVSGSIINFVDDNNFGINGLAVGGYIPISINDQNILPYANFTTRDYLPIISGIILDTSYSRNTVTDDILPDIGSYTVNYDSNSQILAILNTWSVDTNNDYDLNPSQLKNTIAEVFKEGNFLEISIQRDPVFNNPSTTNWVTVDTFEIELTSQEFDYTDVNLVLDNVQVSTMSPYTALVFRNKSLNFGSSPNPFVGNGYRTRAIIRTLNKIIDKNNNTITVKHNNLSIKNQEKIIIDKLGSKISSIFIPGDLSISQISTNTLTIQNDAQSIDNFDIGDSIIIHQLIEDNIKTMPNNISFDKEGKYKFIISGRANILLGKYTYRIFTKENINMPIFAEPNWSPKTYYTDIEMRVNKAIKIKNITKTWLTNQSSWSLTLDIAGGFTPALTESIDVQIDISNSNQWTYCGFNRYPLGQDKDTYNTSEDITIISLSSDNSINWSEISSFNLKISDSTGTDIITISRDQ